MNRRRRRWGRLAGALGLLALATAPGWVSGYSLERDGVFTDPSSARVLSPAEVAAVNGRYRTLLRELHMPQDRAQYGYFYEYGVWSGIEYNGHKNLPQGHWVYVHPTWYIWKERVDP
jgi:hypothetical protein